MNPAVQTCPNPKTGRAFRNIHGFKSKLTFFNRTIPDTYNHLKILEVLQNHFIPMINC